MRRLSTAVLVLVLSLLATTLQAGTASAASPVVPHALFGQHVTNIAVAAPKTLTRVGSIRLWGSRVNWNMIEVRDNHYKWAPLDRAVANAERLGAKEILYTLGMTPRWAATNPNSKAARKAMFGVASNTHPRSNKFYTDYLAAVVKRYGKRISAYQMWNEANLHEFYIGSPSQMAGLTRDTKATLRRLKSPARLVAASTTVRAKGPVGKFGKAYGKAMRKVGWPVDVVSAHFYPPAKNGPATRVKYIKVIKRYYKKYGAGKKPLWDTEMSYGDTRHYMKVKRQYKGATAATYVARTYIDSMRYGVGRVFWYGWDNYDLGTDMTTRDRRAALAPGGRAFITLQGWMAGRVWHGCKTKSKVTTCRLSTGNGSPVTIKWAKSKTRKMKVPARATRVMYLSGSIRPVRAGSKMRVGTQPIAFR